VTERCILIGNEYKFDCCRCDSRKNDKRLFSRTFFLLI